MKCPICGNSKEFKPLFPEFSNEQNHLCMICGLVFIPNENRIQELYYKNDGYFKYSPNISLKKFFINKRILLSSALPRYNFILKMLENPDLRGKRILDIGCGYGEILFLFSKKSGSQVTGLEPSGKTCNIGKEMFGIDIKPVLLEEYVTDEKYDIIICNHTIEHVVNPINFLKAMKKLLKPGGLLYLEVPNIMVPTGGFSIKKFLYKEHLQTFSERNFELAIKKAGLEVINLQSKGFLKFTCTSKNKQVDLKSAKIEAKTIYQFLKKYTKNYNLYNYSKVYLDKTLYLVKIMFMKIFSRTDI